MSPTVFRKRGYRFFFFSREEPRVHIHVHSSDGEAKFWLTPEIQLAKSYRLRWDQLTDIKEMIEENRDEIIRAWREHFGS